MKKWLFIGASLVALPASAQVAAAPSAHGSQPAANTARAVMPLADNWRFKQDDAPQAAQDPAFADADFADADWTKVSVPHTWNRVGYYMPPNPNGLNTPGSVNKKQGVGWYRLSFTPGTAFRGKRAWLEFDAASRIATVWLNGVLLGEHKGGFSRFRLDATRALKTDGPNILAVRVDNSKPDIGSTTADVLPLTGDFFVYGGLYRPVRLIATDAVHLDMLDAGGSGVYATTQILATGHARIDLTLKLRNDGAGTRQVRVVSRLIDRAGHIAAQQAEAVQLPPAATTSAATTLTTSLNVANAHLWQGVDDPYLYRLSVELRGDDGRLLDTVDQPYGIREMHVDPARGLLLNGKVYPLHGVGYHQDREGKGWAITPADVSTDLATMRDMGANSIRLTHYQHGQPVHDEADRLGMIVWDEMPLVSAWTLGNAKVASDGLRANARQQLTELIRQNQNHASVVSWGIANEVDFGDSLPGFLTTSTGSPPDPMAILKEMNALAKATDPSRPTAMANCCEGQVFAPGVTVPITAPVADLAGANRYFGWYYGQSDGVGPALDALHAKRPDQPLAVTEYGAGGAISIHTDNVLGAPVDSRGRIQPEESENDIHEKNWAMLAKRPYLWATWLWSGFDFASTVRHEGDAEDINTKGLVTFDHALRKDAFYFYKANWSANPTVHITQRRYINRAYRVTDVRVYSNAPRTALTLNGVAVGTLADCPQHVCVWRGVHLAQGRNDLSARGMIGGKAITDTVSWSVSPDVMRTIRIDSGALVAAHSAHGQFGSDNFFAGGAAASLDTPGGFGKPPVPAKITGTQDTDVATTYRKGAFGYRVPLDNGRYTVTLTFVEPALPAGERVFDVLAGGQPALPAFDVAKAAGGPLVALRRSFPVMVSNGTLALQFRPIKGEAIVSAVEIEKTGP